MGGRINRRLPLSRRWANKKKYEWCCFERVGKKIDTRYPSHDGAKRRGKKCHRFGGAQKRKKEEIQVQITRTDKNANEGESKRTTSRHAIHCKPPSSYQILMMMRNMGQCVPRYSQFRSLPPLSFLLPVSFYSCDWIHHSSSCHTNS